MTALSPKHKLAFEPSERLSSLDGWQEVRAELAAPPRRSMLARLRDAMARLRARHVAIAELRATGNRELRDIGINRGDIDRLFDPAFADEFAYRGAPAALKPRRSDGGS